MSRARQQTRLYTYVASNDQDQALACLIRQISGGVYMNPVEFQSGSNSFRFSSDHRRLNYICLHESGLSCDSFRIDFIPFFIPD